MNKNNETWKDIPGFGGKYEVSTFGRVKSKRGILKPLLKKKYFSVCLSMNGSHRYYKIHRLVAMTFIPNEKNLPVVNHKDENRLNNCVENLEWCTVKYNTTYSHERHPEYILESIERLNQLNSNNPHNLVIDIYKNNELIAKGVNKKEASKISGLSKKTIYNRINKRYPTGYKNEYFFIEREGI